MPLISAIRTGVLLDQVKKILSGDTDRYKNLSKTNLNKMGWGRERFSQEIESFREFQLKKLREG